MQGFGGSSVSPPQLLVRLQTSRLCSRPVQLEPKGSTAHTATLSNSEDRRLRQWHASLLLFIAVVWLPRSASAQDVVLYASQASVRVGAWNVVNAPTAAGGAALANPDAGQPKLGVAAATPASYFELTFDAAGGQPYH